MEKEKGGDTLLVAIASPKAKDVRHLLVAACWESEINFTKYLPFFILLALDENYLISLEAITTIENMEGPFTETDVKKLNHTGTHPVSIDIAIHHAIDYHQKIGGKRKEERLHYLQTFWTTKVADIKKVYLNTPIDPTRHCGIANVGIEGIKPADLAKILLDKYKIWTVAIDSANVHGVRITPHVYTTTAELDLFVNALKEISV